MRISVRADIKKAQKALDRQHRRQIPFAAKNAVNDTAFGLKDNLGYTMARHIHRPIKFTQNALHVYKAKSVRNIEATVFLKSAQYKYLQRIIFGSGGQKRVVPTPIATNAHGNIKGKSYIKNKLKYKKYFTGKPHPGMQAGLWERLPRKGRKGSKTGGGLRLHAAFEKSVSHGRTYPYHRLAETYIRRNFSKNMGKALRYAIATAR